MLRRLVRRLVILAAAALLAVAVTGRLPQGRSPASLAVRASVGLAAGILLVGTVRRSMRALAEPTPPPPPQVDARASEVVYGCPICGTRVRLEVAATGKPPRHCGEEMEATLA